MKTILFAIVIFLGVIACAYGSDASSDEDVASVFDEIQGQFDALNQMQEQAEPEGSSSSSSSDDEVEDQDDCAPAYRGSSNNARMARFMAMARALAKARGVQMTKTLGSKRPYNRWSFALRDRARYMRKYGRKGRVSLPFAPRFFGRLNGGRRFRRFRRFRRYRRNGRFNRRRRFVGFGRFRRYRRYRRRRTPFRRVNRRYVRRRYRRRRFVRRVPRRRLRRGWVRRRYRRRRRVIKKPIIGRPACPQVMCTLALVQCKPGQRLVDRNVNTGCRVCPHCVDINKVDKDDQPVKKPHCPKMWCHKAATKCDAGYVINTPLLANGCSGCPRCVKKSELKPLDHVIAKPIGSPINPGGYVIAKPGDGSAAAKSADVDDEDAHLRVRSRRLRVNPRNYVWKNGMMVRKDIAPGFVGPTPKHKIMMLNRPRGWGPVRRGSFGGRRCKIRNGRILCERRRSNCKFRLPYGFLKKPKKPTTTKYDVKIPETGGPALKPAPLPFDDPRMGNTKVCPLLRCAAPMCKPGQKLFTPTGKSGCPMCPTCVGKPTKADVKVVQKDVMRPPVASPVAAEEVQETQGVRAVTTQVEEQGVAVKQE